MTAPTAAGADGGGAREAVLSRGCSPWWEASKKAKSGILFASFLLWFCVRARESDHGAAAPFGAARHDGVYGPLRITAKQ